MTGVCAGRGYRAEESWPSIPFHCDCAAGAYGSGDGDVSGGDVIMGGGAGGMRPGSAALCMVIWTSGDEDCVDDEAGRTPFGGVADMMTGVAVASTAVRRKRVSDKRW